MGDGRDGGREGLGLRDGAPARDSGADGEPRRRGGRGAPGPAAPVDGGAARAPAPGRVGNGGGAGPAQARGGAGRHGP
eukprot:5617868-Pleurochrysis_carterae.AAC.1